MPYKDLREFINILEENGELKRIKTEVDWNLELSHISKINESNGGPALLFENVKGYSIPVLSGLFGNFRRLAMALGFQPDISKRDLIEKWSIKSEKKIPPIYVEKPSCKENIIKEKDVDILKFPIPRFYDKDGGRYIGTACLVINKDPDTGWLNLGTYRLMVHDRKTTGVYFTSLAKHGALIYEKYEKRNLPMPMAVAIGVDPATLLTGSATYGVGEGEYDYAGGLRGEPLEVIRGEIVDLPVPANAEIVLEGELLPGERKMEGPFGEYTGYYGSHSEKPVFYVRCITHRDNPIFHCFTVGRPVTEQHIFSSIRRSAILLSQLRRANVPGIEGVYTPPEMAYWFTAVISIKQLYPGHTLQTALSVFSVPQGQYGTKFVIVVDDDIDCTDMTQVLWAVATRVQPKSDIEILKRGSGTPLDPSIPEDEQPFTSRMIIDATRPWDKRESYFPVVELNENIKEIVKNRWKEYGI